MEGHHQYYGMGEPGVAPAELAAVAEELAKTASKVRDSFGFSLFRKFHFILVFEMRSVYFSQKSTVGVWVAFVVW